MIKKYTVGIVTDSYPDSGLGHLVRCSAIAEGIRENGVMDVVHLLPSVVEKAWEDDLKLFKYVDPSPTTIVKAATEFEIDLLLVDSYNFSSSFYRQLNDIAPLLPVLSICDDPIALPKHVHGIVDFNLHAREEDYPSEFIENSIIGTQFYPVRSSFLRAGKSNSSAYQSDILITFGGADPDFQTERVLSILAARFSGELAVIVGRYFSNVDNLKETYSSASNIRFIENCSNIAPYIANSNVVITGGGVTLAECSALSTFAIVLGLAENLEKPSLAAEHAGCAKYLGKFFEITDETLAENLYDALTHVPEAAALSSLVDGSGSARIAERLYEVVQRYHADIYNESSVKDEYEESSCASNEFEKVKWGSEESMLFRFEYARDALDWASVSNWCDIGCGTGAFFRTVSDVHSHIEMTGVDLCDDLIYFTHKKIDLPSKLTCFTGSFLDFTPSQKFSLVTSVGVLQKCGISLQKALDKMASLLEDNGVLFFTTKNLDWTLFSTPGVVPFEGHHWFRLQQLKDAVVLAGLEIESIVGLLPAEGKVTSPNEAHSVAIVARKK